MPVPSPHTQELFSNVGSRVEPGRSPVQPGPKGRPGASPPRIRHPGFSNPSPPSGPSARLGRLWTQVLWEERDSPRLFSEAQSWGHGAPS